ncbi:MAG: hypothetical protein ACK5WB_14510 [Phycisphaerales bacterium]|jgi:hypothetical protein|nr:hypothetical protein [Phycisphaeraceae bacterium]
MDALTALWLPVLVSAAAVWFWQFLSWAALSLHGKDWDGLPDEDRFMNALRELNIPPGNYVFPHDDARARSSDPEFKARFKAKWQAGPIGLINVWPAKMSMGGKMIGSFLVNLLVSALIAYLASITLKPGDGFLRVTQVVVTAGILSYSFAQLHTGIWFNAKPRAMIMAVIDGVVSGVLIGVIFAAMWPGG